MGEHRVANVRQNSGAELEMLRVLKLVQTRVVLLLRGAHHLEDLHTQTIHNAHDRWSGLCDQSDGLPEEVHHSTFRHWLLHRFIHLILLYDWVASSNPAHYYTASFI